jgi:ribosomal protein S18 acetylase RimI-like enzyme
MNRGAKLTLAEARRLEERALNAAGAFQSLAYDGWLIGYRRGPTKRLRCVNPLYASTLSVEEKIEWCTRFYAAAKLPAIFRVLPFSQPRMLDAVLERSGWGEFDRTVVQRTELARVRRTASRVRVDLVDVPAWEQAVAGLLELEGDALAAAIARARSYPLPHAGALIRRNGDVVACGLLKLEGDHAGLFAIATAEPLRGRGLGRAIVGALLNEARRRGAGVAYLQVTTDNDAALALYRSFGFVGVYDYWYRARAGEQY